MAKKLEGNGMWESSRMILPEHKAAIIRQQKEAKRKSRPEVDEQAWEEYSQLIRESFETGREIWISVYDPFEDVVVSGQVIRMDPYQSRLLFAHEYRKTWILFEDIIMIY